jgi:hypothetical protein
MHHFLSKGKLNAICCRKATNSNRILEKDGQPADSAEQSLIGSSEQNLIYISDRIMFLILTVSGIDRGQTAAGTFVCGEKI